MNTRSVVPDWLLDLLMGYLDPAAAHYSRRPDTYETRQNWFDTFLSADHLRASFPQYSVHITDPTRLKQLLPSGDHDAGMHLNFRLFDRDGLRRHLIPSV